MTILRSKLVRLREQSGLPTTESHESGAERTSQTKTNDIQRQLKILAGTRQRTSLRIRETSDQNLANLFGGQWLEEGLIVVDETVPFGTRHGDYIIQDAFTDALGCFGPSAVDPASVVFMDTETTGLAGGTGTLAFLLGLAKFTPTGLAMRQIFLTGFSAEVSLLQHGADWIKGMRFLVTYNGKSFDHPLLTARYRLASRADPFASLTHLDLLHPVRAAYRDRWPDCRLHTAERRLVGFKRIDDLPSSEIPNTWFHWVRHRNAENLPRVLRHNRWDLLSLAGLVPALRLSYEDPLAQGANVLAVMRYYLRRKEEWKAYAYLHTHREHLEHIESLELARLSRRNGNWSLAIAIWQNLADQGNIEALERLAKYHEHVARNVRQALMVTRRLVAQDSRNARHRHRERRLLAKVQGTERDNQFPSPRRREKETVADPW